MDDYDVHNARFDRPTADEVVQFMTQHAPTDHDPTNPEHVTRELMRPFPQSALYQRNKFTYVQYQQVIRRLIYATGNQFQTDVLDLRIEPWTQSSGGHQQVILVATVKLTIPVLQSSRTQMGVQVATVGFGEDMWKGAVSDALKKAAQQFGVAIDLAGADGEDTAPDPGLEVARGIGVAPQRAAGAPVSAQNRTQAPPHQRPANNAVQGQQGAQGGRPASERQKGAIFAIAKKQGADPEAWAREQGAASVDALTSPQASKIIEAYGG